MGIVVALLFILQIISFMIITLLYLRISKFNNLEKKQQQLMKEMDQSVLAYLAEIKEENDRLIYQLNQKQKVQPVEEEISKTQPNVTVADVAEHSQPKPHPVPVQFALRSYQKTAANEKKEAYIETKIESKTEGKPLDDREIAKQLLAEGKSVPEIAREMKKGKTEIELLLKFG